MKSLTRDSMLLYLMAAAAVMAYLATVPPPWEWN